MKVDAEALVAEKEAVIAAIENNEAITMEKLQASRGALEALESQEEAMRQESDRSKQKFVNYSLYMSNIRPAATAKLMWPLQKYA